MNRLLPALLAALFTVACSSKAKPVENPDIKDPDPITTPDPTGGVECALELALTCAEGQADGCLDGRTAYHVCVAATETAGPPCAQEIMKDCPVGMVDACVHTPQLAETHVCVVPPAPAATPE